MGYIIVIKIDTLTQNFDIQNNNLIGHTNITEKANSAIEYDISVNNDGPTNNDDFARKTIYGYLKKDTGWFNIFNMRDSVRKYIDGNTLNIGTGGVLPSATQTGYVFLTINNPYKLKIVELDKNRYKNSKEIVVLTGATFVSNTSNTGWIMPDLSLSPGAAAGSRMAFDFTNKDYAFFLSFSGTLAMSGTEFLSYNMGAENQFGTGVYISALNESEIGIIKYLGTDIVIDRENNYQYKEAEVIETSTPTP